jgi:hypothetical protein
VRDDVFDDGDGCVRQCSSMQYHCRVQAIKEGHHGI